MTTSCDCLVLAQRMRSRQPPGDEEECWNWVGAKTPLGYGRIGGTYTHRVALCAATNHHPTYGVSETLIRDLRRGERWTHVSS